ncbi:choice-of-anchor J domain-containing protein [Winogradskyella sp.]|uniref:T9SS-dependent choice-of-anchor J family protein n=1 Tax=Winogradskyella sp. TaxID=1883156 RepID=UPI0025D850B3|nr:choice-of-anchor J domain-containing protein [Winogradskyella sp.]
MKHFYIFLVTLLISSLGFGQTTVTYDFSAGGASTSDNLDANISFTTAQNSGTTAPVINSGQLRLYQNATKGGSIIITPSNGATITSVIINASGTTGPAGYTVDSGTATNLSASTTYTINSISASTEVEFYQRDASSGNRIYVDSFEVTYTPSGGSSNSTIEITTAGGCCAGEKWSSITTGIDGTGTQVWGQGNGTQCNSSGLLTNEVISLPPGTYYVNCYDQYDDSWDGTTISVTAYGSVIGDNGGVTPDDGADTDSATSCEGTPEELEASFQIIVPAPPSCPDITGLTIDSFTDTTAAISWTAGGSETDWEIVVQADGLGTPGGSGTATATNPHSATLLTESTAYEVYVRANCLGNGFSAWVGPIDFTTAPSCPDITSLTVDSFTDTTAEISWTVGGSESAWEIVVQADGLGTPGGSGTATTSNPYSATSLTASTAYEVFVRANCLGNGFSAWVGPVDFTTTAAPITSFPYNEDFDSGAGGWIADNTNSGSWALGAPAATTINTADSGTDAWVTNLTGDYVTNDDSFVISPPFDMSGLAAPVIELSIWYEAEFSYDGMVLQSSIDGGTSWQNVGALSDPNNWYNDATISNGDPGGQETGWTGSSGGWLAAKNDLTGLGGQSSVLLRVAFGSDTSSNDEGGAFDSISIYDPACPDITGLTIDSFAAETAEISWTAGGTETDWEVLVQADGTGSPASGTATTSNPYSATGLTESTAYEVYVRADCGGGQYSAWVGPVDFTTTALCPEVSGVTIDSFTGDSVTVSWTNGASEDDWEVLVQADGTGSPASGTATTTNPHTESGLTGNTAYEVYVRADCNDASNGYSTWVGPVDFTTSCVAIVPDYIADMSTNVPDSCWDEATNGEVAVGPTGLGSSSWSSTGTGDDNNYGAGIFSNRVNIFGTTALRDWLISPTFNLSSGGPYQLEINVAVTNYNDGDTDDSMGSDDEVQLLISTDGGSTWTNLTTWNSANEPAFTGTEYTEDLTAYSGNAQFAIWASNGTTTGQDYDFHVGKFNINAIPSSQTVDYCNLQSPSDGSINEGSNFDAYARVYVAGFTEAAGSNPDIEAWIGVSTTDATTAADFTSPNWTWVPATFNNQFGNDDEYQAEIGSSQSAGTHYYVSRFRADGGPYAYGGITPSSTGGNFWDGTNFVSGQLTVIPTAPTTVATININGCGDSGSYNGAYASITDDVVWVELIYDGNCSEITVDTESTTGVDTEIGLYDAFGNLIDSNDDGGTGSLSLLTELGLPVGTYYIAAGAFNIDFASNFGATSSDTTDSGTLYINASTPNLPDYVNLQFPGAATIIAGNTANVYAQIYEAGNTPGAGAGTNITAEIGISAVNATTATDFTSGDWTWTAAPYFGESGNNDEYELAIGASLTPGTYYYVSRFSVDGGPFAYGGYNATNGNEWDGSTYVSGVLTVNPATEPTNHVLTFTAVADSDTEITVTWTDNDGSQAADGFLIVAKTSAASFFIPVDGTEPADDTDWSDDEAEIKIGSGVQTYTFTGLTASTLYEFEIYPYTNSGSLIDFKTDITVPSASATTDADPCALAVTTFPFEEGFEDLTFPPQCWSSFRGTNGEGTGQDWERSTTANTGSGSAFVRYEGATPFAQDWLVTPALDLSALPTPELSFFARDAYGTDYGNIYTIRVSTTDTNIASFTTVQTYSESDFSNTTFGQFTVDLSAYNSDTTVYIAFVMENDNGDNWYVDDVKVEDVTPVIYTYNGTWSPSDPNGTATANDDILVTSGNATFSSNTTANTITVNAGASITVNTGITLTAMDATDGLTLESISTSYSSLILNGTITGTVNYKRHVNGNSTLGDVNAIGDNDLISAPLSGQTFGTFAAANSNLLANPGDATEKAFAIFDKTTGAYENYFTTTNASTTLDAGVGYRAAANNTATLTFTGTVNTGVITNNIENSGPAFADWNLIGNPYPSYLKVQDFLNYEVATGVDNLSLFVPTTAAIYGYDGDATGSGGTGYTIYNLANTTPTSVVAPGQGFLVSSDAADVTMYDVTFDPSMRTTGTSDDFILGRDSNVIINLELQITSPNDLFVTDFYFNESASLGLDPGYDAAIFGGNAPAFALYSHLVEENMGTPFAIQTLGEMDFGNTTVALGVNANQGEQLVFNISESTLPSTIDVYLDDALNNTSTLLNTSDYILTPTTNLNGTGRFYLRLSDSALSNTDSDFNDIKIYTTKTPRSIYIHGVLNGETTAKVYDLQGRLVYNSIIDNNNVLNQIDATDLSDGVYVITLSNGLQQKSQKVIIR